MSLGQLLNSLRSECDAGSNGSPTHLSTSRPPSWASRGSEASRDNVFFDPNLIVEI
jgi:hypothetical protein